MAKTIDLTNMHVSTDLIPPDQQLPFETTQKDWGGIGILLFSLVWMSIPAFMLYRAFGPDTPWFAFAVMGVFLFIGVGLFVLGLVSLLSSKEWGFGENAVSCTAHGLTGTREWTEPLSHYEGVLAESEYHSGGRNSSGHTTYTLTLKHKSEDSRSVQLYRHRSEKGFRQAQERYARMFGLPTLQETADGMVKRSVDQLDKSVRELVAEGDLEVDFDPSQPPPGDRLEVRAEGEELVMQVGEGRFPRGLGVISAILIAGGISLAIGTALGVFDLAGDFVLFGAIIAFAGLGGVVLAMAAAVVHEMLRVSPGEVIKYYSHPWGRMAEKRMPAGKVEEVIIKESDAQSSLSSVHVISDQDALSFGAALSDEEKKWVRKCIVAVISADVA